MRIAYETMLAEFERVLTKYGFSPKRAHEAAEIFAQNSLAGVFSHGLNRFPRVVEYLRKGEIDPAAEAECIASFGAMERWDGKRGFGPLNAKHAMDRAVELAHQFGIGMVALATTTTGCAAAPTAGRPQTRAASASAGPTPAPTCLHGAQRTTTSATTRSFWPCRARTGSTSWWIVP